MSKPRVGVLISGRGSNLQALLDASARGAGYEIRVVIANIADAAGLERARAAHVPAIAVPHAGFGKDRAAHERAIDAALRAHDISFVALAGYMRVLTPFLVRAWEGRMINIHPSLLPAFPGLDTHRRALEAGVRVHGCTVHYVTEGVDEGRILGQAALPVLPGDTPETLGARVLELEHRLYPTCLALALGVAPPAASDQTIVSVFAPQPEK